ncbi:alpha/beta fold hydrolase [Poseidonocella sp. HB161398]|uniref:alpha/beta fold hydrolase n=1 Tax=Poseidonocella sp. HB161398 TaxID=2320855 RepID=UPI001109686E|nr:alpha/beta hydrolase [Poseidonocella sp. HB161398]
MDQIVRPRTAATVPTRHAESRGRRLAYRQIGTGPDLILALRFRGVMDSWDPAFLDALARDFTVTVFDYSGLGQSTGTPSYIRADMAQDVLDLADALGIGRFVLGGWSLGGVAVQVFAAEHPERVSHLVLIGTTPPGPQPHGQEPVFYETALKPENDLEDELVLFFEPASAASRAAGTASHQRIAARSADPSPPVPQETFLALLKASSDPEAIFPDPGDRYGAFFRGTEMPVLVISGDHEIVFPVENWHALNRAWPTLHLVTIPQAGHGPQHQQPVFTAALIAGFTRSTPL